jgi:hypothetical protein
LTNLHDLHGTELIGRRIDQKAANRGSSSWRSRHAGHLVKGEEACSDADARYIVKIHNSYLISTSIAARDWLPPGAECLDGRQGHDGEGRVKNVVLTRGAVIAGGIEDIDRCAVLRRRSQVIGHPQTNLAGDIVESNETCGKSFM